MARKYAIDFECVLYGVFAAASLFAGLNVILVSNLRIVTPNTMLLPYIGLALAHQSLLVSVCFRNRHSSYRCLGVHGKSVVGFICFSAVMLLRHIPGFDIFCTLELMSITAEIYVFARAARVAYDIGARDVLPILLMQLLVYLAGGNMYALAATFLLFASLTFYQYVSYSPPVIPIDTKRVEDYLP